MAGEEVSWGQRVFRWRTPEALKGLNQQSELTLHNLLTRQALAELGIVLVLVWLLGLPLLIAISRRFGRFAAGSGIFAVPVEIWPYWIGGALLYLPPSTAAQSEICEAVIATGGAALACTRLLDPGVRPGRRWTPLLLLLALPWAGGWLIREPSRQGIMRRSLNEMSLAINAGQWERAGQLLHFIESAPARLRDLIPRETAIDLPLLQVIVGKSVPGALEPRVEAALEAYPESSSDPARLRNRAHLVRLLGRENEARLLFRRAVEVDRSALESDLDERSAFRRRTSLEESRLGLRGRVETSRIPAGAPTAPLQFEARRLSAREAAKRRAVLRAVSRSGDRGDG